MSRRWRIYCLRRLEVMGGELDEGLSAGMVVAGVEGVWVSAV